MIYDLCGGAHMHYLYRITDALNNKVYIGQTVDNKKRWMQHKSYAKNPEKTGQYIHRAMNKYGVENFTFEIIATCLNQEDANEIESVLIVQYDSRNKENGYNLTVGGNHGGHSEETKQKLREATLNQIATLGHPAQGRVVSEEERELHRKDRLENPIEYTKELRKKMSEAHIGTKDTKETKQNKAVSAKTGWEKRQVSLNRSTEFKCNAPGCEINGAGVYYLFIDNIRYCGKHAQRLKRKGSLN